MEPNMRAFILSALTASALIATVSVATAQQRQGGAQSQNMDMNASMARCAQVRQQVTSGAPQSALVRQMLDQCDQMDRSMGMAPPARR